MKVVLVSPLPPPSGGIATWTVGYSQWCQEEKIDLAIVNLAEGQNANPTGRLAEIIADAKRTLRCINKAKKALKGGADILHINSSCRKKGLIRDYFIVKKASKRKIKVVLHCHCDVEVQARGEFARKMLSKVVKLSDEVIVLNQSSKEFLTRQCNITPRIISNFVANVDFTSRTCNNDIKKIVFVGNLLLSKGVKEIIETARQLPDMQFDLIGKILPQVAELESTDNVHYLGEMPREDVIEHMRGSDLLLFPSHTEGFPGVVLEAMTTGLPIIATPVGAIPEMLEGRAGVVVPVNNVEKIIKAINALSSVEIRQKMSDFAIMKAKNVYSLGSVMARYMELYQEALND